MKTTSILKAIPLSFYSSSFYREVGQTWKGRSFLYLLVLLLIAWLGVSFFFTRQIMQTSEKVMIAILNQMPTLQFKQGMVTTTKPGVFYIRSTDDQKEMIVIDTNNQYTDFNKSSARVLIKKDSIWVKQSAQESNVYNFPKEWSGTLGPKELSPIFCQIKQYGAPIVFSLILLFGLSLNYLIRVIQGLFYGVVGWIFGRLSKNRVHYEAAFRIALVAMTPAIVMNTILSWIMRVPIHLGWIGFIVTVIYVYFGIRAMQDGH